MKTKVNPIVRKQPIKIPIVKREPEYEVNCATVNDGIEIIDDDQDTAFNATIADFAYCCGAYELGEFSLESNSSVVEEKNFQKAVDQALSSLVNDQTNRNKCRTFISTLTNTVHCNIMRDSFKRTGLFSLVKTYINMGSSNQIELWVSNN